MLTSHVQKIARVLNILVLIALVCNLILLFFVPVAVRSDQSGLLPGTGTISAVFCFPVRMTFLQPAPLPAGSPGSGSFPRNPTK